MTARSLIDREPEALWRLGLMRQCPDCRGTGRCSCPLCERLRRDEGKDEVFCPNCSGRGYLRKEGGA